MTSLPLYAYTDGACPGRHGIGGWGVLLIACDSNGNEVDAVELSGGEIETTNSRMELMAAIYALEILPDNTNLVVVSDSKYVVDGITKWIKRWRRNNWIDATKREIKNLDLWKRLDTAHMRHTVKWRWVKGHNGHKENERADALARAGVEKAKILRDSENEADRRKMGH